MRTRIRASLAAAAITVLCGNAAFADNLKTYFHVGSWDAFSGPGADGRPLCGVGSTNPTDNRSFSLRFAVGGDSVLFQVKKPNWNIPSGTQIPVVMQIGLNTPWNVQGGGNGQVVEWTMDRDSMQTFDAQFRGASSMTLTFPTGNEPPWLIGLNGSMAISNAFGRCVTDMAQQQPVQPSASAAAAPQAPTQPFSQAPAQPVTSAPPDTTQPVPTQPGPTQPGPAPAPTHP